MRVLSVILCFLMLGCVAGGGGSNQTAPDMIKAGEPAIIRLELSVWGSGGTIENRYTDIKGYYKLSSEESYKIISPKLISQNKKSEEYEFKIPAYPQGTSGKIEYYFEMKLDGHFNSVNGIKSIGLS